MIPTMPDSTAPATLSSLDSLKKKDEDQLALDKKNVETASGANKSSIQDDIKKLTEQLVQIGMAQAALLKRNNDLTEKMAPTMTLGVN